MKKSERNKLIKKYSTWTDEQLEKEYWNLLYNDVLGSQAEAMEEAGWEDIDVREQREYEDWADEVTNIIEGILLSRGIDVWRDYQKEDNNNYEITAAIDDIIDMIGKGVDLFE